MKIQTIYRFLILTGIFTMFPLIMGCPPSQPPPPKPGTPDYSKVISLFYKSLAALDAGDTENGPKMLLEFTKIAPFEPAAHANYGLLLLRNSQLDKAAESIKKAQELAPDDVQILMIQALLEKRQGKSQECIDHLKIIVSKDPRNLKAAYGLYEELERLGGPNADKQALPALQAITKDSPDNLFAELEQVRLATKMNDKPNFDAAFTILAKQSTAWRPRWKEILKEASTATGPSVTNTLLRLRNVLSENPQYIVDQSKLKDDDKTVGIPLNTMVTIPSPPQTPAPLDLKTKFESKLLPFDTRLSIAFPTVLRPEVDGIVSQHHHLSQTFEQTGDFIIYGRGPAIVRDASGKSQTLAFPGTPIGMDSVLVADLNYDFKMEWAPDRQGKPKMIAITRAGEWEMKIDPYPFTGDRFDCPLPGRRIPKQLFRNNEEYHAAYYAAHPVTLPYALVR